MLKSLKAFGIAFLISAVVLGIAAAIIMGSLEDVLTGSFSKHDSEISDILNGDDTDDEGQGSATVKNDLTDLSGESFSVLCVMTDYRPDVYDYTMSDADGVGIFKDGVRRYGAAKICIVRCSKETGRFVFIPLSPLTRVSTAAGNERLYDVYTDYGIDFLRAKIEAVTGIPIDKYAVINCNSMNSLTGAIGAVWCSVPCDIYSDGKEFLSEAGVKSAKKKDPKAKFDLYLEKCEDYIGPSSMGLLLFKDYTNGIEDELTVSSMYLRGIFQNLAKFPEGSLGAYWENIKACVSFTDIDSDFVVSHAELVAAYNERLAKTVKAIGVFRTSGDDGEPYFDLDQSRTVDNLSEYR